VVAAAVILTELFMKPSHVEPTFVLSDASNKIKGVSKATWDALSPSEARSIRPVLRQVAELCGPGWRIELLRSGILRLTTTDMPMYKWSRCWWLTDQLLPKPRDVRIG